MNLVLTGFMGSGKTEVGKLSAGRLGMRFIDVDAEIEKDTGLSIPLIFSRKGEPLFRELESRMIGLLSVLDGSVISTGGGAVLLEQNMLSLKKNGLIVYLAVSPAEVLKRVGRAQDRPLLAGAADDSTRLERITSLLESRMPLYRKHAMFTVNTDGISQEEVTESIVNEYGRLAGKGIKG